MVAEHRSDEHLFLSPTDTLPAQCSCGRWMRGGDVADARRDHLRHVAAAQTMGALAPFPDEARELTITLSPAWLLMPVPVGDARCARVAWATPTPASVTFVGRSDRELLDAVIRWLEESERSHGG